MSDINLRMALDAACDLIVALIEGEGGNVRSNAPMLDEWRSLASSPPPDLEGPMDEEVEAIARALWEQTERHLYAGKALTQKHLDFYWFATDRSTWRDVAREAWRLGARTMDRTGRPAPGTGGTTP